MEDKKAIESFLKEVKQDSQRNAYNAYALKRFDMTPEINLDHDIYILKSQDHYQAYLTKQLGDKNQIADDMFMTTDKTYYDLIAQDVAATTVNRLATIGATPLFLKLALTTSSSHWIACEKRAQDLRRGWKNACLIAKCANAGISLSFNASIRSGSSVLAGVSAGVIKPQHLITGNISDGDAIILIGSSGVHTEGFDLITQMGSMMKDGYLTQACYSHPDIKFSFGAQLLTPSLIYPNIIKECQKNNINIHYAIDVENWLDLMRHPGNFSYVIEECPMPPSIFNFIQKQSCIDDWKAYSILNMGIGFALYVPKEMAELTAKIIYQLGFKATIAGYIENWPRKKLFIKEKNLVYSI